MDKQKDQFISAREVAAQALRDLDFQKHDIASRLDRLMDKTNQRARATDLVFGVIRNLSAIDLILRTCADMKHHRTDKTVLAVLRIGTYELVYVSQTPDYAVVNDAVALASQFSRKAGGFVNAVLRNVQRAIVSRNIDLSDQPLQRILPIDNQHGCLFNADILPSPEKGLAEFLAAALSLPSWLVQQWLLEFGPEKTKSVCIACNRHPSVLLRPNRLKITVDQLAERLGSDGVEVEELADKTGLKLAEALNLSRLTAFREGLFYVQDQAAFDAINILPVRDNMTILDLCAAPGTKTSAIAMKMNNTGTVYATDIDKNRLQKVIDNSRRLGLNNIQVIEPRDLDLFLKQKPRLDAVIADVPCSNTGVLARRVEARWRLEQKAIKALVKTQREILNKALSLAAPGGAVLYSTCSILADENQNLVRSVLPQFPSAKVKNECLTLPKIQTEAEIDHDGGYAALITC